MIKASSLILKQALEEKFNGNAEEFYDSGYPSEFFAVLPQIDLTKYITYLAENLRRNSRGINREIDEFKTLLDRYGEYLYSEIVEGLVYAISEELSETLSNQYEDEGSERRD